MKYYEKTEWIRCPVCGKKQGTRLERIQFFYTFRSTVRSVNRKDWWK